MPSNAYDGVRGGNLADARTGEPFPCEGNDAVTGRPRAIAKTRWSAAMLSLSLSHFLSSSLSLDRDLSRFAVDEIVWI